MPTSVKQNLFFLLFSGIFCLGLLAAPSVARATSDVDAQSLRDLLEAPFQSDASAELRISDFSATFTQQAHIASLNRSKQGHGKVMVRFNGSAPASFRWDYLEPEKQHIISNGKKLWVYLPESKRVMISDVEQHLESGDDPLLFLRSLDNLERHFNLSIPESERSKNGAYLLTLTPKKDSAYVSTLTLHIPEQVVQDDGGKHFPLGGVTILDPNGNTTALEFSEVEVNTRPETKRFNFSVPPGVEIVHPDPEAGM
jgi:outer membrane lipoprotein carrier protein